MQKQIGCSGKSLSHHEHRRAVRPAGGNTGCQGLSAVFMGHISHAAGGVAAYPGMGLYVQDGGLYQNAMQSAAFARFSDMNGNWNGLSVSDVFGDEEIKIGYTDGWLSTSQNMVKILLSYRWQ